MKKVIAGLFLIASTASAVFTNNSAGVVYSDGTNVMSLLNGNIISTNTGTKIQGYEVQGTAVVESGIGGVSGGMLSIADEAAGFAWQNLTFSNGVLWQVSATETNLISKQICEISFIESAEQTFTGGGGYQIVTNLAVNYTDGACLTATTTGMVVGTTGYYLVEHGVSLEATTGAAVIECDLFADESDVSDGAGQEIHWKESFTVTANTAFKGFSRIAHLTAGEFVSLRIDPGANTETVRWFSGSLRLTFIRK